MCICERINSMCMCIHIDLLLLLLLQGEGHGKIKLKIRYMSLEAIYAQPRAATVVRLVLHCMWHCVMCQNECACSAQLKASQVLPCAALSTQSLAAPRPTTPGVPGQSVVRNGAVSCEVWHSLYTLIQCLRSNLCQGCRWDVGGFLNEVMSSCASVLLHARISLVQQWQTS